MHASKNELPILVDAGPALVRGAEWEGMRAGVVSVPAGTDFAPLLKGLPGDLCPCPHWGYVMKGRLRIQGTDGEETLREGDVFYLPPGHTGVAEEDTEFLEISPADQHQRFVNNARRNLAAMQAEAR
ncbi:MAG: cupin domain-containing protein [Gemmatimonadota bacterium]|nr:cupin domain-containing protein [Gemmatimonadota bacterium]